MLIPTNVWHVAVSALLACTLTGCSAAHLNQQRPAPSAQGSSRLVVSSLSHDLAEPDDWEPWRTEEVAAQLGAGVGIVALDLALATALLSVKNEHAIYAGIVLYIAAPLMGSGTVGIIGDAYSERDATPWAMIGVGSAAVTMVSLVMFEVVEEPESVAWWWGGLSFASVFIATLSYHLAAPHVDPGDDSGARADSEVRSAHQLQNSGAWTFHVFDLAF